MNLSVFYSRAVEIADMAASINGSDECRSRIEWGYCSETGTLSVQVFSKLTGNLFFERKIVADKIGSDYRIAGLLSDLRQLRTEEAA
ncbi:hypothetical protein GCM10023116_43310 [Kistimonas scapharcae]|uniref:Uncharacterized protein n=1 Tax=Kistimonas scapharcae TaxID=1036133 RepID=A0ABP8V834_9GAMM